MANANWYTNHESSLKARHIHSINFNIGSDTVYNTWDDWHLIPSSRPVVNPPAKKRVTIDVPGSNGIIDESNSLRKFSTYESRTGSWEFYVENDYTDWQVMYSRIMESIHGFQCKVTLDDDPGWYYSGTIQVNEWKSTKDRSMIVLDYDLYPYKRYWTDSTDSDWLWDPFNFETDNIYGADILSGIWGVANVDLSLLLSYPYYYPGWLSLKIEELPDGYFESLPVSPIIILSGADSAGIKIKMENPELDIHFEDFNNGDGLILENTGPSGKRLPNFTLSNINKTNKCTILIKDDEPTKGIISFKFVPGRF